MQQYKAMAAAPMKPMAPTWVKLPSGTETLAPILKEGKDT
jgi:hypothetical protein